MKRFGGKRGKPSPAMNVTPLVDVVLVLLIIFMVVLPRMENEAQLELPHIFNVDEEPRGRTDPITVSVTADHRMYLEQTELERASLEAQLRQLHDVTPTRRVILRGDSALRYQEVRSVFELCQSIGFPGVSLRVGQREHGEG
jgi:biopolymer transport protein TolR